MQTPPPGDPRNAAPHLAKVADLLLTHVSLAIDEGEWSRPDFALTERSTLGEHDCVPYVAILVILAIARRNYPDPWDFLREIEPIVRSIRTGRFLWSQ